nr:hypothetical protein GCM10020092_078450 [Actinoplanes digitatis]
MPSSVIAIGGSERKNRAVQPVSSSPGSFLGSSVNIVWYSAGRPVRSGLTTRTTSLKAMSCAPSAARIRRPVPRRAVTGSSYGVGRARTQTMSMRQFTPPPLGRVAALGDRYADPEVTGTGDGRDAFGVRVEQGGEPRGASRRGLRVAQCDVIRGDPHVHRVRLRGIGIGPVGEAQRRQPVELRPPEGALLGQVGVAQRLLVRLVHLGERRRRRGKAGSRPAARAA